MIRTQEETELFNFIIEHNKNVVAHIQSIRPDIAG
jgi:hypothetical protein